MKRKFALVILAVLAVFGSSATVWGFTSGSTGADGAFNPASNTAVQLPANGTLNYTTVNIPAGVTVTFTSNAANTPVYILATGDVTIAGTLNVNGVGATGFNSGQGGPGGFNGGLGGTAGAAGGKGLGPGGGNPATAAGTGGGGAGYNTGGGAGTYGGAGGGTYGNVRIMPMIGGSGGGGGAGYSQNIGGGGGGGGGAILIASSGTITISGSLIANGGNGGVGVSTTGDGGGGSGGSIKLMANTITGEGTISANAGIGGSGSGQDAGGNGGTGRIRFEANTVTRTSATSPGFTYDYPGTVSVTNIPTLTITSIAGVAVPGSPSGRYGTPDVTLPPTTTNPVTVNVSATNIPVGTQVTVTSIPEYGAATSIVSTGLSGTLDSSTTSVSITLATSYQCVLMAQATYTIQTAMYYDGEKIEKVRVAGTMGRQSEITYITESGREIESDIVMALMR
jgi:hypothetical protein